MARKTLILELDLENAAFAEGFGDLEASMILKAAAARIEGGALAHGNDGLSLDATPLTLRDTNGNAVGTVRVENRFKSVKP